MRCVFSKDVKINVLIHSEICSLQSADSDDEIGNFVMRVSMPLDF